MIAEWWYKSVKGEEKENVYARYVFILNKKKKADERRDE